METAAELSPDELERLFTAARAQLGEAQKRAGTGDLVARVRRMPDGSIDVVWDRRSSMQQKLRYGSVGGRHPALAKVANGLGTAAPKGKLYVVAIAQADDRDATLHVVTRALATPATPAAAPGDA